MMQQNNSVIKEMINNIPQNYAGLYNIIIEKTGESEKYLPYSCCRLDLSMFPDGKQEILIYPGMMDKNFAKSLLQNYGMEFSIGCRNSEGMDIAELKEYGEWT